MQYSSSDNIALRESSFHMKRRGDEDIEGGGAPKIFRHPKGELWKNQGGAPKICMLQNQQEGGGS